MKKHTLVIWYTLAFLIGSILVISSLGANNSLLKLENHKVNDLNEGWWLEGQVINLPVNIRNSPHTPIVLKKSLDLNFKMEQTIKVRASLQHITLMLEDEVLYAVRYKGKSMPVSSAWHLITLPEDSDGKILTLILESPYPSMSGVINPIVYGNRGAVTFHIIENYGLGFLFAAFIFISGVFMCLLPIYFGKAKQWQILYLGFFAKSIALWLISESRMIQFVTSNVYVIGGLAYISLCLFPLWMILYIREAIIITFKKAYLLLASVFVFQLLLVVSCQGLGWLDFYETLIYTHFLIAFSMVYVLFTLFYEVIRIKNNDARRLLMSFAFLCLFGFIELLSFYLSNTVRVSSFVIVGLMFFIGIQLSESSVRLMNMLKKAVEAEYFQKLAYGDRVTGGLNRMAFEEALDDLFQKENELVDLRIVIFDLNGLKTINDQFGHVVGDDAIKRAYECIVEAFGDYGTCYRIGGDEYAALLRACDDETYQFKAAFFQDCVKKQASKVPYPFGLAWGSAAYDPDKDTTSKKMMHRADEEMYLQKNKA